MSQSVAPFRPPLLRAVDEIGLLLDEVAELDPIYLTTGQKEELLVALARQGNRLASLTAKTLATAGDVAEEHGTRDAGAWLAHETRQDPDAGRRAQRLAEGLDLRWPILAQAYEAKLLAKEEQEAWDKAAIAHRRLGNGISTAAVTLPDAVMDRWLTQLHAFTSPRRESQVPPSERVPYPRRLAHVCSALLERIPAAWLPQHGGTTTTVVVTIDQHALTQELATAGLTTGTPITAGEARRLACGAGILPAVLDGKSQPLDLGRTKRLFTPGQHRALAVRDRECRAQGCDIPAAWCEAHHLEPWSRGGRTNLKDGALLCSFHHHRAHDSRYQLSRLANGDLRYHRRT